MADLYIELRDQDEKYSKIEICSDFFVIWDVKLSMIDKILSLGTVVEKFKITKNLHPLKNNISGISLWASSCGSAHSSI